MRDSEYNLEKEPRGLANQRGKRITKGDKHSWREQLHGWWVYLLRLERQERGLYLATLNLKVLLDIEGEYPLGSWICEFRTW